MGHRDLGRATASLNVFREVSLKRQCLRGGLEEMIGWAVQMSGEKLCAQKGQQVAKALR